MSPLHWYERLYLVNRNGKPLMKITVTKQGQFMWRLELVELHTTKKSISCEIQSHSKMPSMTRRKEFPERFSPLWSFLKISSWFLKGYPIIPFRFLNYSIGDQDSLRLSHIPKQVVSKSQMDFWIRLKYLKVSWGTNALKMTFTRWAKQKTKRLLLNSLCVLFDLSAHRWPI